MVFLDAFLLPAELSRSWKGFILLADQKGNSGAFGSGADFLRRRLGGGGGEEAVVSRAQAKAFRRIIRR